MYVTVQIEVIQLIKLGNVVKDHAYCALIPHKSQ